jgi:hypothetical protein
MNTDRTIRETEGIKEKASQNLPQQVLFREVIENYNKINANCKGNLQKVSKVKLTQKCGNFNDKED